MPFIRPAFVCLLSLFLAVSVLAQEEPANVPATLDDAKTFDEVRNYLTREADKINQRRLVEKKRVLAIAELYMPVSEKMLEFAESAADKRLAYMIRYYAHSNLIMAEVEGAEQKMETFLSELSLKEEISEEHEEALRLQYLMLQTSMGTMGAQSKLEAYVRELTAKEQTAGRIQILQSVPFFSHITFEVEARQAEVSAENFSKFKTALQARINQAPNFFGASVSLGFDVARANNIPTEQFAKEVSEFIQSPQCRLSEAKKKELLAALEGMVRLAPGVDPKLYGKTLDDKDFKWESLREKNNEKYVLIKFTATWCGPCKAMIPDMLEAYEKYHDKGLEIISVYIEEQASDPVAAVRKNVEDAKLPWIILSEALTVKADQPAHGEYYGIYGVPRIVLTDKEGKIMPLAHGEWKAKLAEIFE